MAEHVIGKAGDAARHPLSTLAYAVGVTRGLVASVIRIASGGPVDDGGAAPEEPSVKAGSAGYVPPVPPAPQRAPEPPGESFATEPHAVSRASAHARGGADDQVDDWYAEAEDVDEGPTGIVEILEAHDPVDRSPDRDR